MTSTELIAKIKAEIERLQKYNHCMADNAINSNMRNFYDGEEDCCKQLLSFLSTLESEKPVPKDLEVAAEEFAFKSIDEVILYGCTLSGRRACFIAGAKWRDRQLNWARDLVQAGIDKPEEAVNILKRLKELIQLLP